MKNLSMLVWLTQLGLSVVVPPAGFILLAVWLRDSFGVGSWVVWTGIVLGLVCAAEGLYSSLKAMARLAGDKKEKDPIVSFNDHD